MRRTLTFCLAAFCFLAIFPSAQAEEREVSEALVQEPHAREELGVNEYTTPLIAGVFSDLDAFDRGKFAALFRLPGSQSHPLRAQLALNVGQTIAEGFIAAMGRDQAAVEKVARALLRQSEALAVSKSLKKRGQSLLELASQGSWTKLRDELTAAQQDVETALIELRDEEVAHLIGLGGWLRGLEISSRLTHEDYTTGRAANLDRIGLVDYYCERVQTLQPALRKLPLFRQIDARLSEIRRILFREGPPDREEVARLAAITRELNEAISKPVE